MQPKNQSECIDLLTAIQEVSEDLGTPTYIWGGLVPDIMLGKFVRPHHDIDGFTINLNSNIGAISRKFSRYGFKVSYLSEFGMLQIHSDGIHCGLNCLEIKRQNAYWHHVGDYGTIVFPADWLDSSPRDFYGVKLCTSGARFEYAIKTNVHLLNPEWRPREVDHQAARLMAKTLSIEKEEDASFLLDIYSVTPYWADRGYPEYENPVYARFTPDKV